MRGGGRIVTRHLYPIRINFRARWHRTSDPLPNGAVVVGLCPLVIQTGFEKDLLVGEHGKPVAERQVVHAGRQPHFKLSGSLAALRAPKDLCLMTIDPVSV